MKIIYFFYFFLAGIGLLLYYGLARTPQQKTPKSIINYTNNQPFLTLYNIRDLTGKLNDFPCNEQFVLDELQEREESDCAYITEKQLVNLVKDEIDKTTWEQKGCYIKIRHSTLIVRQTKEVHQQIELLLEYLRKDMDSFSTKIKKNLFN